MKLCKHCKHASINNHVCRHAVRNELDAPWIHPVDGRLVGTRKYQQSTFYARTDPYFNDPCGQEGRLWVPTLWYKIRRFFGCRA